MKKQSFLLCLALLASLLAVADPVTPEQARRQAQLFMQQKKGLTASPRMKKVMQASRTELSMQAEGGYYYVFNVDEADGGFVVVSGDDRTAPILGYAASGTFDADRLPPHLVSWLNGYAEQIKYMERRGIVSRPTSILVADGAEAVAPLVASQWDQDAPYYNKCPKVGQTPTYTGCAATALAQVLGYHRHPARTLCPSPGYTTRTRGLKVDELPETDIDWDNILDLYAEVDGQKNYNRSQASAVATLMLLSGAALEMDYTTQGSGAYTSYTNDIISRYFDYDPTAYVAQRFDYTADEWERLIYNEVASQRPVLYSGISLGGGHAFVVDGYDGEGLFHLNWGWSGMCDSYFRLAILNPNSIEGIGASSTNDGFSYQQEALIGARPNEHSDDDYVVSRQATTDRLTVIGGATKLKRGTNGSFTISVSQALYSIDCLDPQKFDVGLGLFDASGQLLSDSIYATTKELHIFGDYYQTFSMRNFRFAADLPDGTYYILGVSCAEGAGHPKANHNSLHNRLKIEISGDNASVTGQSIALKADFDAIGPTAPMAPVPLRAVIINSGTDFHDDFFLLDGGQASAGFHLDVAAGDTLVFDLEYVPISSGSKKLSLATLDGYTYYGMPKYKSFADVTLTIRSGTEASGENHLRPRFSINELDGQYVRGTRASGNVEVINDGKRIYWADVVCRLLVKNDDGLYEQVDSVTQNVLIFKQKKAKIDLDFTPLELGRHYALALNYAADDADEQLSQGADALTEFQAVADTIYHLALQTTVTNADEFGTVRDSVVTVSIQATNDGDYDYCMPLTVHFLLSDGDGDWERIDRWTDSLQLPKGEQQLIELKFATNGITGTCAVQTLFNEREDEFTLDAPLHLFTIVEPEQDMAVASIMADTEATATIFDLAGRRVSNPKRGLCIMKTSDGLTRKVCVR